MRPDLFRATAIVPALLLVVAGCAPKPTSPATKSEAIQAQEDVLSQLPDRLRRETSPEAVRALLQQLDTQLNSRPEKRAALSSDELAARQTAFRLDEVDLAEIRRNDFTALDTAYLIECLMFRDAVRSLEMESYPATEQVEILLGWVMRQIWPDNRLRPPAPAGYVARRGSGDGLERAYVFLAALQQLGFDAVLIGPPDAADRISAGPIEPKPNATQPSPFWLVGVVVEKDVLLFDPWQGTPVRNADGKGIATLAQFKAKPEAFTGWLNGAKHISFREPAPLARATVYMVAQLSALSPRLQVIEQRLMEGNRVRLVTDVAALRSRLQSVTGSEPMVWNPPLDPGTYTKALSRFLPVEEGGLIPTKAGELREFQAFCIDLVPWGMFPRVLRELRVEGAIDIQNRIASTFIGFVLEPGSNHEKLIRGQYNEVIRGLSQTREDAARYKERAERETGLDQAVIEWVKEATAVYADVARAKRKDDPIALQSAQARVADFRKNRSEKFDLFVQKIASEQVLLEATYLVALCKLEQAERAQTRLNHLMNATKDDRAATQTAWESSAEWWQQFLRQHRDFESLYPGRFEQARRFADRAARMAKAITPAS